MTEKALSAVNIIGAGLAGLSAAKTFAAAGVSVRLISYQSSERAQSNLAEGGINAALDVMGEADTWQEHFQETMKGGCDLADPNMVRNLTKEAPRIVRELDAMGVPFHREQGHLVQRNFGGQKKKRTAYAKSSTGKVLMAALIDAVRRYEAKGLVKRYPHHLFERLLLREGSVEGAFVRDRFTGECFFLGGEVLMACGGMNGLFAGATTGTTANTGSAAAMLFVQGVEFANLEFLQYHPTTVSIAGKRLLISEAARGEGGRLFCREETAPAPSGQAAPFLKKAPASVKRMKEETSGTLNKRYFMEEKYGEKGNLMPRDVVCREMAMLGKQAYLDLTGLDQKTWEVKLSDLREEVLHYLGLDPAKEPVPVSPGIHYFMGGILVDEEHRTSLPRLYAAGECACAYHGANRLGGNSLLGAVFGGQRAAEAMLREAMLREAKRPFPDRALEEGTDRSEEDTENAAAGAAAEMTRAQTSFHERMVEILLEGLAPLRSGDGIGAALEALLSLRKEAELSGEPQPGCDDSPFCGSAEDAPCPESRKNGLARHRGSVTDGVPEPKMLLAEAMLRSALARTESRGAHTRLDCPETKEEMRNLTVACLKDGEIRISFRPLPELKNTDSVHDFRRKD